MYLRRALLSGDVLGGAGVSLTRVLDHHGIGATRWTSVTQPDEAAFRLRLRAWLRDNNPGLPTSSTSDEYWQGQARWHQALYDAGFFGLSWPRAIGGQELPSVYDVILDEELAAGRRAAPSEPRLPRAGHPRARQRGGPRSASCPASSAAGSGGARGSASPTPAPTSPSLRTRAERDGDDYVITGHKVWTSYSDDADWCLVLARTDHDVPKHKGISAFVVPMDQPGIEQRPIQMINGITRSSARSSSTGRGCRPRTWSATPATAGGWR